MSGLSLFARYVVRTCRRKNGGAIILYKKQFHKGTGGTPGEVIAYYGLSSADFFITFDVFALCIFMVSLRSMSKMRTAIRKYWVLPRI